MKLTKLQQEVYDYIKDDEYCQSFDISEDLEKPMNVISRILNILYWDLELIERKSDPDTYRCISQGASTCEEGWVLTENTLQTFGSGDTSSVVERHN